MWRLLCHYFFLIPPSCGASGMLCFVIVAFLGYPLIFFQCSTSRVDVIKAKPVKCINRSNSLKTGFLLQTYKQRRTAQRNRLGMSSRKN